MEPKLAAKAKPKVSDQTLEESRYLKRLIDDGTPIRVKLVDNDEFEGKIEFYDAHFIRLTRTDGPNLFIFKHDIKYLYEVGGDA
ncbi:MAG: hypothetical protein SFV54_04560 [Bryobacteraceae bacterium]|nr:hypothetical protein [Bryobacteraceae bacterium]